MGLIMFRVLLSEMVEELTLLDQCEDEDVRTFIQRVLTVRSPLTFMDLFHEK